MMANDIYFFNPTCELAVANGSDYYMPPEKLRRFERELSLLPTFLAQPDDIVLVAEPVSSQFVEKLSDAGFELPTFMTFDEIVSIQNSEQLFDCLRPWGWSPAAHKYLSAFKPFCSSLFHDSAVANWGTVHRDLYGRKSGLSLLAVVIKSAKIDWFPSENKIPQICTSHEEIIELHKKWGKTVVKAPWSSSGRGLQVMRNNEYNRTNRQIISGILKQQGFVTVGPWHDKILDVSFQFFSDGNGQIEFKGLTTFSTDDKGRFQGNYIEEVPRGFHNEVTEFLLSKKEVVTNFLLKELGESDYAKAYCGWLGIDALIYRDGNSLLKFHPCIEINCRFTMGAVALNLRKHVQENSSGKFSIFRGEDGLFGDFCHKMSNKNPIEIDYNKIVRGFLPLTPFGEETQFGAYLIIDK